MQLEAIASSPIAGYLREETNTCLTTTSFQVFVETNKVLPQPPLLQTKQPQFPQLFLLRLVLQTPHQPHCPSLDTLQHLNVLLVVRGPKLNTVLEMQPYQYRGMIISLLLLATLFLIQARVPLVFLATWAHCWLTFSWLSTSIPRGCASGTSGRYSLRWISQKRYETFSCRHIPTACLPSFYALVSITLE